MIASDTTPSAMTSPLSGASGSSRILVISDSFHTLPEAVEALDSSGHTISYVHELTSWADLKHHNRQALQEAEAVIMGRVLGIEAAHFSLAPN